MRIFILDTYYEAFLNAFHASHAEGSARPYAEQWRALMDECFGTADFYSHHLNALGHEAKEFIANDEPLQRAWARDQGMEVPPDASRWRVTKRRGWLPWLRRTPEAGWFYPLLRAQIQDYRPDVLYVQDMNLLCASFLREMKSHTRLIVGQIACPIAPNADFSPYDLVLTSFPHFVEKFRSSGLKSEYLRLAFEPRVLERLSEESVTGIRYPVAFVGGLSSAHHERIELLEAVAKEIPLDVWGYGDELLRPDSPLRANHHGEAWGLEMYRTLQNADIVLNHHIGVADGYANNMRLYEATGVGTLLLTDWKQNLSELFKPDDEVAAYRSAEECIELIKHYSQNTHEQRKVARAGQERTLREHSYLQRMAELSALLENYL